MTPFEVAVLALKICVPMLLALAFAKTFGRRHPEMAHLGLTLAFVAAILLPIAAFTLPTWRVPLLPRDTPVTSRLAFAEEKTTEIRPEEVLAETSSASTSARFVPAAEEPAAFDESSVLFSIWGVGAGIVSLRLAFGSFMLRRLRRGSMPLPIRADLASRAGLDRSWELRRCPPGGPTSALTWGTLRPIVLLPSDSVRWTEARMENVLLHELAHVRRGDALAGLVAEIACALYWFNPLMWFGARILREEAERSADRAVLRGGVTATDYAADLLALAAGSTRAFRLAGVQAMNSSKLESRLRAVLSGDTLSVPPSGARILTLALASMAVVPALAAFQATTAASSNPAERTEALKRLKRVAIATAMYAGDYDDTLPDARSTAGAVNRVRPYAAATARDAQPPISVADLFQSPSTGGRFLYNPRLARVSMNHIESPAETPVWYESLPDANASFVVAYVDGHVKSVNSAQRESFLKAWAKTFSTKPSPRRRNPGEATPAPPLSPAQQLARARAKVASAQARLVRAQREVVEIMKSSQADQTGADVRRLNAVMAQEARVRALRADVERREAIRAQVRAEMKSLQMERQRLQSWQKALEAERKALEARHAKP